MLVPGDEIRYAFHQVMICPGFSLRPGSKLRELPAAARRGRFAIGDEHEREFLPEYGSGGAASRGSDGRRNAAPGGGAATVVQVHMRRMNFAPMR